MTVRTKIIVAVGALVFFAAMVGFFVTLDVSPQIAYARLFIDVGLVIGLIAVIMALHKETPLPTENIVHALSSLKKGKYQTRLSLEGLGNLGPIASGLNDLAISLEDHHHKQEEIKRNLREELLPKFKEAKEKEVVFADHSIHPELGPVIPIVGQNFAPKNMKAKEEPANKISILPQIDTPSPNEKLSNTLIESRPPAKQGSLLTLLPPELDLGDLYQRFITAQKENSFEQIEYSLFLKTIESSRAELIETYHCNSVDFDVVNKDGLVALQPRLIR